MIERHGSALRQCTVTADVPPGELLLAILAGQRRVSDCDIGRVPLTVRCELGLWHGGEQADWVWDWDHRPTHALWAAGSLKNPCGCESLPWCDTPDTPHIDPTTIYCGLYQDHAGNHSWSVFAPEIEALRLRILAEHPEWFA
jgi:hypothetical protein